MKTFFGGNAKKGLVGENLLAKVAQKLFGLVWGISGKNPSHP